MNMVRWSLPLMMCLCSCAGFFQPLPDPMVLDKALIPGGTGWHCAQDVSGLAYCERDQRTCAILQRDTPDTSACFFHEGPAYCFAYASAVWGDEGKMRVRCFDKAAPCDRISQQYQMPPHNLAQRGKVSRCEAID